MLNRLFASAAVASLVSLASSAQAATVYQSALSGLNESPVVGSPGVGYAIVTVDEVLKTMQVKVTFSGLTGITTAAHIHCCAPAGVNAGVATQTPSFLGFPAGVHSGFYDNTFDLTLASSYRAGFITANGGTIASAMAALLAGFAGGNTYLNVHTNAFPGGEIRGQLIAVPEPATWAMMIGGFGLVGITLRRRRVLAS